MANCPYPLLVAPINTNFLHSVLQCWPTHRKITDANIYDKIRSDVFFVMQPSYLWHNIQSTIKVKTIYLCCQSVNFLQSRQTLLTLMFAVPRQFSLSPETPDNKSHHSKLCHTHSTIYNLSKQYINTELTTTLVRTDKPLKYSVSNIGLIKSVTVTCLDVKLLL